MCVSEETTLAAYWRPSLTRRAPNEKKRLFVQMTHSSRQLPKQMIHL